MKGVREAIYSNPERMRSRSQVRISFAFHVAKRRFALGLTQSDIAEKVGLTRTSIVNIEGGKQGIALEDLREWAKALKWTLPQLIKGLE